MTPRTAAGRHRPRRHPGPLRRQGLRAHPRRCWPRSTRSASRSSSSPAGRCAGSRRSVEHVGAHGLAIVLQRRDRVRRRPARAAHRAADRRRGRARGRRGAPRARCPARRSRSRRSTASPSSPTSCERATARPTAPDGRRSRSSSTARRQAARAPRGARARRTSGALAEDVVGDRSSSPGRRRRAGRDQRGRRHQGVDAGAGRRRARRRRGRRGRVRRHAQRPADARVGRHVVRHGQRAPDACASWPTTSRPATTRTAWRRCSLVSSTSDLLRLAAMISRRPRLAAALLLALPRPRCAVLRPGRAAACTCTAEPSLEQQVGARPTTSSPAPSPTAEVAGNDRTYAVDRRRGSTRASLARRAGRRLSPTPGPVPAACGELQPGTPTSSSPRGTASDLPATCGGTGTATPAYVASVEGLLGAGTPVGRRRPEPPRPRFTTVADAPAACAARRPRRRRW